MLELKRIFNNSICFQIKIVVNKHDFPSGLGLFLGRTSLVERNQARVIPMTRSALSQCIEKKIRNLFNKTLRKG